MGGLSELSGANRCLLSTQCARHRTVWSPNRLEMGPPKPPKGKEIDLIAPRAWTSKYNSISPVLRSHPGTRSRSSPQQPGGACEHPGQVPPLLCPQPSKHPLFLVLSAPVKSRTTCPTHESPTGVRFRDKKSLVGAGGWGGAGKLVFNANGASDWEMRRLCGWMVRMAAQQCG